MINSPSFGTKSYKSICVRLMFVNCEPILGLDIDLLQAIDMSLNNDNLEDDEEKEMLKKAVAMSLAED